MASQNIFGPVTYSLHEMSVPEHRSAVLRATAARRDDGLKWKAATMLRNMARAVGTAYSSDKADETYEAWRKETLLAAVNKEPYQGEQPTERFPDAATQAAAFAAFGELREAGWFPPLEGETPAPSAGPKGVVASELPAAPAAAPVAERYEAIKPQARAVLKKSNPELFAKLREDWQRRGMPAGA